MPPLRLRQIREFFSLAKTQGSYNFVTYFLSKREKTPLSFFVIVSAKARISKTKKNRVKRQIKEIVRKYLLEKTFLTSGVLVIYVKTGKIVPNSEIGEELKTLLNRIPRQ